MANIHESYGSRSKSGNTTKYLYTVTGTDDLGEVLNLIAVTAPEQLADGTPRGEPDAKPHGAGTDGTWWECQVVYSPKGATPSEELGADPGQFTAPDGSTDDGRNVGGGANSSDMLKDLFGTTLNFSTGGGTRRLTQAVEHIASYVPIGATYDPPDHKGAINVQPDGTVDGVEVAAPNGKFSFSRKVPNLTVGYFKMALSKTAKVNSQDWKGFKTREALFEGMEGSYDSGQNLGGWLLTYHIAYSPTQIIDNLVGWPTIRKRGWDYFWVEYKRKDDSAAKSKAQQPYAAHVERVYDAEDFNDFQL